MPFTPSHAVVALPFARTRLVPAAVAVGAMTPDLPLFVRGMIPHYGMTHDFAWMPLTVAVAAVLLLVWRCVLRPAARELAPKILAERLPAEWDAGARAALRETVGGGVPGILWLVTALVIGVVSHIAWDLFTHEGRAGEQLLPLLAQQWGPLAGVKWLQHGSSVLGLVAIAVWAAVWVSKRRAIAVTRVLPTVVRVLWLCSLPVGLGTAAVVGAIVWGPFDGTFTPTHLAYAVLPQTCAVWGLATVVLALVVQVRRGRTLPRDSADSGARHARDVA